MGAIWNKLCTYEALKDGWYLASKDLQQDFIQIPFLKEQFASSLDSNLQELVRQLKTEQFRHQNVIRTEVSKGNLSTRPGSIIPLESRVVLFAAIKLIAKQIDDTLIEGVYSYRVKDEREIFENNSLRLPPFIKQEAIAYLIDPFGPWYDAWPKFEVKSIEACIHEDYRYLAVSDISAYFENIQLEILRDQLLDLLSEEQQITNLFISAFSFWTSETPQGRQYMRGLPQGSNVPSFFGNMFLAPVDWALRKSGLDIKYYRYMDDIRIFAKTEQDAKKALLKLEQEVRKQHLNLQSAKTKILKEQHSNKEVSHLLIDSRLTRFKDFSNQFEEEKQEAETNGVLPNFERYLSKILGLMNAKPDAPESGEEKIRGAKKSLTGLSDRLFRQIIATHISFQSDAIVPRLLLELSRNGDQRYDRHIVNASRTFPRCKSIQSQLLKMMIQEQPLTQEQPLAPSREAEFIRACRYQSRILPEVRKRCIDRASDKKQDNQVRMQALILLSRVKIDKDIIKLAGQIYQKEENILIKRAASLVLIRQKGNKNEKFVRSLAFHPNNELRKFGRYIHLCKTDEKAAKYVFRQAFKKELPWLLVDYMPLLYLQSQSSKSEILGNLKNSIHESHYHKKHINMDMRELLMQLLMWLDNNPNSPPTDPSPSPESV